jgi:hypothetical protein
LEGNLSSNTAQKQQPPGVPFKKGDPRINRKGRPKSFDALRALAQEIANEAAKKRDGEPIILDGHIVTVAEAILRQWSTSNNPMLQMRFIEITYGKVPDVHELTGKDGNVIEVTIKKNDE